jgi:glycyl-tRNA synthetase
MQWWQDLGLAGDNLIMREHDKDELAHYAKEGAGTADVEYRFPFTAPGYGELEGVAHRTDFDLKQHQSTPRRRWSTSTTRGEPLPNGQPKGEWYLPHVIEPSRASTAACSRSSARRTRPTPTGRAASS